MFIINTSIVQCIFPNQLFEDASDLQMQYPVFLIEELLFFKLYKFHKQKIVLHNIPKTTLYRWLKKYNL